MIKRERELLAAGLSPAHAKKLIEDERSWNRWKASVVRDPPGDLNKLPLSSRLVVALASCQITTFDELKALTDAQFLRLPGVGAKSLASFQEAVAYIPEAIFWDSVSRRDQRVYSDVRWSRKTHAEIAKKHGCLESEVSEIYHRIHCGLIDIQSKKEIKK